MNILFEWSTRDQFHCFFRDAREVFIYFLFYFFLHDFLRKFKMKPVFPSFHSIHRRTNGKFKYSLYNNLLSVFK